MAVKSREIRELLGKSHDPVLVRVIIQQNEAIKELERQLLALAQMTDKLIDHTNIVAAAQHNMMHAVEKMPGASDVLKKLRSTPDDLGGDDGNGSTG